MKHSVGAPNFQSRSHMLSSGPKCPVWGPNAKTKVHVLSIRKKFFLIKRDFLVIFMKSVLDLLSFLPCLNVNALNFTIITEQCTENPRHSIARNNLLSVCVFVCPSINTSHFTITACPHEIMFISTPRMYLWSRYFLALNTTS